MLHSEQAYPDMPSGKNNKFVKSVDEGTFNRMKQGAAMGGGSSGIIKDRGTSHNTIEHAGSNQINQFG